MKVGIVGAGAVGSSCLLALVMRGSARDIVLVNRNRKRAKGVVTDVQYGAVLSPTVELRSGDYSDLAGASLVMITAGVNEKSGGATDRSDPAGRLRLLKSNVEVYQEIIPQVHRAAPNAMVLVVTDPPDPLTDLVRKLGHERALSTGTFLDSLRFRYHLARRLTVNPANIDALVVGEHGTSEVFLWSSAQVAGTPVWQALAAAGHGKEGIRVEIEHEVRYANITIIEGIGASQYGIGMVCARITEMVLRDERSAMPIGSYNAKYGVTLSLPSIIGRDGVVRLLEPEMSAEEQQALDRSAEAIREAVHAVDILPR